MTPLPILYAWSSTSSSNFIVIRACSSTQIFNPLRNYIDSTIPTNICYRQNRPLASVVILLESAAAERSSERPSTDHEVDGCEPWPPRPVIVTWRGLQMWSSVHFSKHTLPYSSGLHLEVHEARTIASTSSMTLVTSSFAPPGWVSFTVLEDNLNPSVIHLVSREHLGMPASSMLRKSCPHAWLHRFHWQTHA